MPNKNSSREPVDYASHRDKASSTPLENGKQAGAVYKWEVKMCDYNAKDAIMFHYFYLVNN